MATLVRLSDVLLPAMGDKPGAVQAETPVFLDFLIGASPASRKKVYTDGLNWLEASARAKYQKAVREVGRCGGGCDSEAVAAHVDDGPSTDGGACGVCEYCP